jgi:hypothetical protein
MPTCECGAEITFVVMAETGRKMPVDLPPVSVVVPLESGDPKLVGRYTTLSGKSVQPPYVPHWASCPLREKFKRKGKPE